MNPVKHIVFSLVLASAALAAVPASAMVETIVVTAEPALTPRALAFFRAIDRRLTPRGKAFSLMDSQALADGRLQPADVASHAAHDCAVAFPACGSGDAKALEFHVLASALMDWHAVDRIGLDKALFTKAAGSAEPFLLHGSPASFRAALLSRLPPVQRALLARHIQRMARIRDAIQATLMPLGYPDGGLYKISN